MTEYLTSEAQLTPYMAFPRFLIDQKLSEFTRILYVVLLDRARMSLRNRKWMDEEGHVYNIYPVADLARDLHKSEMTIKNSLAALEEKKLIRRIRGRPGYPTRIYVMTCIQTDSILSHRQTKNEPSERQNITSKADINLSSNKNYINKQKKQKYQYPYCERDHFYQRTYECSEEESL